MAIYELNKECMVKLTETTFAREGIMERQDLQRILRDQIDLICDEILIIAEEFSQWEDSSRRIDLLGLDVNANLVVIELKRTQDGGLMDIQAIRYAAMVSTMTFDQVADAYENYLHQRGMEKDARQDILDFLGWGDVEEGQFAKDVSIVLIASDFSKELTTAVLWLNQRDLNIRCVRLKPYRWQDRIFLDIQQVIPLPEASEYQIRIKQKEQKQREAARRNWSIDSFLQEIKKSKGQIAFEIAQDLVRWSSEWADGAKWQGGNILGGFCPVVEYAGKKITFWAVWSDGNIEMRFMVLKKCGRFQDPQMRLRLLKKLNHMEGVNISESKIETKSLIKLESLTIDENLKWFKDAVTWTIDTLNS